MVGVILWSLCRSVSNVYLLPNSEPLLSTGVTLSGLSLQAPLLVQFEILRPPLHLHGN